MTLSLPRGTSDYGSADAIKLNMMRSIVEETFKRFGFYPIETPTIELMETLSAKAYGEESKKEIYVIEGGTEGLRYDFTVPLARYIAMNKDLPMPFKRYQIGKVWRMDEPQKMRNREFIQADVDVIGSTEVLSDAEVLAAGALAIERLGISNYTILLNSRVLLDSVLGMFNIPKDKRGIAMRIIDKLEKIGASEVQVQLSKTGQDMKDSQALVNFITKEREDNGSLLAELDVSLPSAKAEISRLRELLSIIEAYGIKGSVNLDLSLARGLDYYTGVVWELVVFDNEKRLPTIGSGGRYDKLIGMYSSKEVPAVGFSIGLSRAFEVLRDEEMVRTYAKVYLAPIKKEDIPFAIGVAAKMRANKIYVDMNLTSRGISKQLDYANSLHIPYAVIIGSIERQANKVKLRNMQTGEEKLVGIEECLKELEPV